MVTLIKIDNNKKTIIVFKCTPYILIIIGVEYENIIAKL
jgi:hypothetical protein